MCDVNEMVVREERNSTQNTIANPHAGPILRAQPHHHSPFTSFESLPRLICETGGKMLLSKPEVNHLIFVQLKLAKGRSLPLLSYGTRIWNLGLTQSVRDGRVHVFHSSIQLHKRLPSSLLDAPVTAVSLLKSDLVSSSWNTTIQCSEHEDPGRLTDDTTIVGRHCSAILVSNATKEAGCS